MLLKNLNYRGNLVNMDIDGDKIISIKRCEKRQDGFDMCGRVVMEPLVDSHIHLDSIFTAGKPRFNQSGTLFEGIEIWKDASNSVKENFKKRVYKAINQYIDNGVLFARTHIDVTGEDMQMLTELLIIREEIKDFFTLQIVAFPQNGILTNEEFGKSRMVEAISLGVDVLGGIPHFEHTYLEGVESMKYVIDLAVKNKLLVDIHCDEMDDPNSRFLEIVAKEAMIRDYGEKITVSHTTAFGSYNNAYASKLFSLLKKSKINFVANPLVNSHLGGRFDEYPKRRGLTRVKEICDNGLNISFGNDDIFDPWFPIGTSNMHSVLMHGLITSHMGGMKYLQKCYDYITINGAKTLNLDNYNLVNGSKASFVIFDETDHLICLSRGERPMYVVSGGEVIQSRKTVVKNMDKNS